jgi:hypothetical protein
VFLFDGAGEALFGQTTTRADGSYAFTGLPLDAYMLVILAWPGQRPTTPLQVPVILTADRPDQQVDFGLFWYNHVYYLPLMQGGSR